MPPDGAEAVAWSWLNQELEDAPLEATHALPAIAAQVIDATTRRRDIIRDSREREVYTIKHTHGRPRKTQSSGDFRPSPARPADLSLPLLHLRHELDGRCGPDATARPPGLPFPPPMESTRALRADLFDPASLAALGRIEIVARWVVDGFMAGLHRSPRKGFSVEFADYRPYQPGDDLRYIDWKIAARSDRWVVRQYEEETNLRATIVLDVSRSMAWSGAARAH